MFPHGLFLPITHCSHNHRSSLLVSTQSNLLLSCGYKIPFSMSVLLGHGGRLIIGISSYDWTFESRPWTLLFLQGEMRKRLDAIHLPLRLYLSGFQWGMGLLWCKFSLIGEQKEWVCHLLVCELSERVARGRIILATGWSLPPGSHSLLLFFQDSCLWDPVRG